MRRFVDTKTHNPPNLRYKSSSIEMGSFGTLILRRISRQSWLGQFSTSLNDLPRITYRFIDHSRAVKYLLCISHDHFLKEPEPMPEAEPKSGAKCDALMLCLLF